MIPAITAIVIFTTYLIAIAVKYGILKSISDSDYWLEKPYKYMFELTMFICGLSLVWSGYLLNAYLMYIGGGLIFCVGLFPRFKRSKLIGFIHSFCATVGFILATFSFWVNLNQWYLTILIAALTLIANLITKNKTLSMEVVLGYSIFAALLYNLI